MYEDRVVRKIIGLKEEKLSRNWRRLHGVKLHDFTPNQISYGDQIRKIKWVEHVAIGNERKGAYGILVENPEIKEHSQDIDVNGWIT